MKPFTADLITLLLCRRVVQKVRSTGCRRFYELNVPEMPQENTIQDDSGTIGRLLRLEGTLPHHSSFSALAGEMTVF
ncbi:uncharacterized protein [Ambystoma mexicanum]|uniref:uncharacterized protein isoform X2 n=1 Tax=Ambystoma mexicanum TaxID=8296 RepID=UPI0037E6FDFE